MGKSKYYLIAGGVISAFISILHIVLATDLSITRYIAAGQQSTLFQMAEQGSILIRVVTIILAFIFAIWALYAFSGAGLIKLLPLLRTGLITISVIYILRAISLPSEINMVLTQGYPFRFMIYSIISLVAGLLYLIGYIKRRASLKPIRKS